MRKIGLIVAVEQEVMKDYLGLGELLQDSFSTTIYRYPRCEVYAVRSGPGEIFAACATQHLIDAYGAEIIFNYGIVGGCSPFVYGNALRVVESVVHYPYDISSVDDVPPGRYLEYHSEFIAPYGESQRLADQFFGNIKTTVCASGDKFIADAITKVDLFKRYGAEICDMESAGIVITCNKNKVPCVLLKSVADTANEGGPEYWEKKLESSRNCFGEMVRAIEAIGI